MLPALVRSPAWMRTSPDGMSWVFVWVSDMHTIRIGGFLGAGDDRKRFERRQRRRNGYRRGALRRSCMGDFGSKSSTLEKKNI
jgi:hypothetical protein